MDILTLSQIIFNLTVSVVVIFIGILLGIAVFGVIKMTKSFKNLFNNLNQESIELYKRIDNFLNGISNLSFISKFFNKKSRSKK